MTSLEIPSNLKPTWAYCHRVVIDERAKECAKRSQTRTLRHRMAKGMLEVIYQAAHKRKLRDEGLH